PARPRRQHRRHPRLLTARSAGTRLSGRALASGPVDATAGTTTGAGAGTGTGDVVAGAGPISRRRFLTLLGAAGAAVAVGGRLRVAGAQTPPVPPGYVVAWPDGVIAGDPLPAGTVIWSRVDAPAGAEPVPVTW